MDSPVANGRLFRTRNNERAESSRDFRLSTFKLFPMVKICGFGNLPSNQLLGSLSGRVITIPYPESSCLNLTTLN